MNRRPFPPARTAQRRRSNAVHDHVAYWLGTLRYVPEPDEIIHRWGVSRATAYRWRAFALRACSDRT